MLPVSKPRLVWFRWATEDLPPFLALHLQQHVQCLSKFFDVTVIDRDCDYREVCDTHRPDLALFESGVYAGTSDRDIKNVSAYPDIPKIGFCHADGFCFSRQVFFSDMERWGVDTFFALSLSMAEYTPEVADRLFVWPNCVDPDLFKDYGLPKVIPVAITGSHAPLYPWRNRVSSLIARHYPSLVSPHFGWTRNSGSARMLYGEPYARMLNAAWMVPACGTMAKDLVRKHLEIPASRTCLITERTPAILAAGFEDMKSCVFADESDVLDKIDWLFRNPDELQQIIDAGHALVHSRHTMAQRNQLFQWFELRRSLGPQQMIVQRGPFDPLSVADVRDGATNRHVTHDGIDRVLLRQGNEHLHAGRFGEAQASYLKCLAYYPMAEPQLRLALTALYKGDAADALQWIRRPIARTLGARRAFDPDPVEWAYFIVALLCNGQLQEAAERSRRFPWLRHPELDRARALACAIAGGEPPAVGAAPSRRHSPHQLPDRSAREWLDDICRMLAACGQDRMAGAAKKALNAIASPPSLQEPPQRTLEERRRALPIDDNRLLPRIQAAGHRRLESVRHTVLPALERRLGPFLPYRLSIARQDDFLSVIESIGHHDVRTCALLVGASAGVGVTEAFLAGIERNAHHPSVVCVNTPSRGLSRLRRRYKDRALVSIESCGETGPNLSSAFDVVIVDASELPWQFEPCGVDGTSVVVLDDIDDRANYENSRLLIESGVYALDRQDAARGRGYAVFRRTRPAPGGTVSSM